MTAAEQHALDLIYKAKVTPEEWCRRIEKGRRGKPYNYEATNYYQALVTLRGVGAPPVVSAPPSNLDIGRSIIFLAQDPGDWLASPTYYKLAITADPAYRHFYTADFIRRARAQGRRLYAWCDCHTTFPDAAKQMVVDLGLDGWYGECESAPAFGVGYAAGAPAMVGNLSALRPDQLALVAQGRQVVTVELYRNCQPGQQPDWRNANRGVAGNCVAFYKDADCKAVGWEAYPDFVAYRDSIYGVQPTATILAGLR